MAPSPGRHAVTRPPKSDPSTGHNASAARNKMHRRSRIPTVWGLIVLSLVIQLLLYHTSTRLKRMGVSPDAAARSASGVFRRDEAWLMFKNDTGVASSSKHHQEQQSEDAGSGTLLNINYTSIYFDAPVGTRPFVFVGFALWAAFLFAFIGISASDFFCPNLATVADRLGMGESTAGVTFLAFGNGSPDVFSTFSALRSNTFSLAIGELLGASAFIISVVVGSMSLVQPFHVPQWPFVRDVGFFTVSVCVLVGCLADGHLTLIEAGAMVGMYVAYVGIVVGGNWLARRRERRRGIQPQEEDDYKPIEQAQEEEQEELLRDEPTSPAYLLPVEHGDTAHVRSRSSSISSGASSDRAHSQKPTLRSRRSSSAVRTLGTPHIFTNRNPSDTPRPTFSLLGAVEFRDIVNSLRKESGAMSPILPDGGVVASPAATPGVGPTDDPAAGYFGQLSPFSRGHYHQGHQHHAARHSIGSGSEPGLLSPGTGEQRVRRSASQVPTPLRNDLGNGVPPAADAVPGGLSRTISAPAPMRGSLRSTPVDRIGSTDHTRWTAVEAITEVREESGAGSPSPSEGADQRASTGGSSGHRRNSALSPVENPWQDIPSHPAAKLRPQIEIPSDSGTSGRQHGGHRTLPSISVTEPDLHTEEIALLPASERPAGVSKRQRLRHLAHATYHLLFPSLHDFRQKSRIGQVLALFAVPAIFCLTITLPVVDDAAEEAALNRGGIALSDAVGEGAPSSPGLDADAEPGYSDNAEVEDRRKVSGRAGHMLHHLVDGGYPMSPGSPSVSPRLASRHASVVPSEIAGGDQDSITSSEDEQQFLFNKYLAAVQCVMGPVWFTTVLFSDQNWGKWVQMGAAAGGSAAAVMTINRGVDGFNPFWRVVRCFMGFLIAMVWIAAIADEVVQILQTFGQILGLSDAIIGLTIFAVGNSLADWVANLTVATFAPSMSYAACFGGPMLNILLGVGGAGTFVIASTGRPYPVYVSPTLWVSAIGLIILLVTTLIFVPLNGFLISRKWGWFLIGFYLVLTAVNIFIESRHGRV